MKVNVDLIFVTKRWPKIKEKEETSILNENDTMFTHVLVCLSLSLSLPIFMSIGDYR